MTHALTAAAVFWQVVMSPCGDSCCGAIFTTPTWTWLSGLLLH
jgi:hypothetical protein